MLEEDRVQDIQLRFILLRIDLIGREKDTQQRGVIII